MDTSTANPGIIVSAGVLGVVAVIALHLVDFNLFSSMLMQSEFENFLHCVGFAVVGPGCLIGIRLLRFGGFLDSAAAQYALAFIAASMIGGFSELSQVLGLRDASTLDLLRDMAGALGGLLMFSAVDTRQVMGGSKKNRTLAASAALIWFLVLGFPFVSAGAALHLRDRAAPRLFSFESWWEKKFYSGNDASLAIVDVPKGWSSNGSKRAVKVTFLERQYPGISFSELFRQWGAFSALSVKVFSMHSDTILIHLRVNDRVHNNDYYDRFNTVLRVAPGENNFVIPVEEIRRAPRSRQMNMESVSNLCIFAVEPEKPFDLYIDEIAMVS